MIVGTLWVIHEQGNGFHWLIGFILIIIGISELIQPFRNYQKASTTKYVLTKKYAIIYNKSEHSRYIIKSLISIELDIDKKKKGDVLFFDRVIDHGDGGSYTFRDGFIGIADAEKVEREMRRLQAAA